MNNGLRVKLRAMLLQMKDVTEQRKLEKHELHPNVAASSVIGFTSMGSGGEVTRVTALR